MNGTLTAPARRWVEDTACFYRALRRLEERIGVPRRLDQCNGRAGWPERGVYFFFEHGEPRDGSGAGPRVVRVGTHALKSGGGASLWSRLRGHRGDLQKGGGHHRGSIFRLLVGAALAERDPDLRVATWGRGSSARRDVRERETGLERRVSRVIGEMPLLWLAIDDPPGPASLRGYVERNAIALLAGRDGAAPDPPSPDWLGRHCPRETVRRSGLWNQRHVDEHYDEDFPATFERLVADACKNHGEPAGADRRIR